MLRNTQQFKVSREQCPDCGDRIIGDGLTVPRFCVNIGQPVGHLTLNKIHYCGEERMLTKQIEYNDNIQFIVKYEYEPEELETFTNPACPAVVTVCEVLLRNINIIDILDPDLLSDLESKILS